MSGLVGRVRRWLRRESADVAEAWDGLRRRSEADLDRREALLHETPEEAMARLEDEIRAHDERFEELRRRLGGPGGGAGPGTGGAAGAQGGG